MSSARIGVVDGLRGIAILAVLFFHIRLLGISPGATVWEHVYVRTVSIGWAGVDLFFVLSGFLITGILLRSRDNPHYYRTFYVRRTLRIFPLYYVSLALFYWVAPAILVLMHNYNAIRESIQPSSQIFAWLYLINWRIAFFSFSAVPVFIHHFWSLSIEEQFYLAWPFVIRRVTNRSIVILCGALIVGALACRVFFHVVLQMPEAAYVLTFCRLDSLALGALVALAARDRHYWSTVSRRAPLLAAVALGGLAVIMGVTREFADLDFWMGTLGISLWDLFFASCLVVALGAQEGSLTYRVGSSRVLTFFGKYSYCLYVCHQPLIICLARAGVNGDDLTGLFHSKILAVVAMNGIVLIGAVLIGLASWNLFEKHFLKLKERFPDTSLKAQESGAL